MWKYIYWTYRPLQLRNSVRLPNESLNGWYDTSLFNKDTYWDYYEANMVKISHPIPNDRFTWKIPVIDDDENPTGEFVDKKTRFVMFKYSDKYAEQEYLSKSIANNWALTNVEMFSTPEEAIARIKANTDLEEVENWKFLISKEFEDETIWEIIPAKYLIIN